MSANGHRSITQVGTEMHSYYGRPILKEPVWQPEIPWYFWTGGIAGASGLLSLAARFAGQWLGWFEPDEAASAIASVFGAIIALLIYGIGFRKALRR